MIGKGIYWDPAGDEKPEGLEPVIDEEGWPERHYCPVALPLVHTVTGSFVVWRKPCGSWWCRSCGEDRARWVLLGAQSEISSWGRVWFGIFQERETKTLNALRKRRQRADKAPYLWVRRGEFLHVYSSTDLSGSDLIAGSAKYVTVEDALEQVRVCSLKLPGVDKSRPSGSSWRQQGHGDYRAPVGPISSKAAKWIEEWVRSRLPGDAHVANWPDHPEFVSLLWEIGFKEYTKQRRRE